MFTEPAMPHSLQTKRLRSGRLIVLLVSPLADLLSYLEKNFSVLPPEIAGGPLTCLVTGYQPGPGKNRVVADLVARTAHCVSARRLLAGGLLTVFPI